MTNIVEKDISQSAQDLLVYQFKEKPTIKAFLEIFTEEMQEAQTAIFELLTERLLNTAIGAQLEDWGEDVGESRKGRSDEAYRKAIRIRIAINTSNGTEPVITSIGKLLTEATKFITVPVYPASLRLLTNGTTTDDATLKEFLKVVAAGIGALEFEFCVGNDPLSFDDDPTGAGFDEGVLVDKKLIGDWLFDNAYKQVIANTILALNNTYSISDRASYLKTARSIVDYSKNIKNYQRITGVIGASLVFSELDEDFTTSAGDNICLLRNGEILPRSNFTPVLGDNSITLVSISSIASDEWTCLRTDITGSSDFRRYEYYYNWLHGYINSIQKLITDSEPAMPAQLVTTANSTLTALTALTGSGRHSADKALTISLATYMDDLEVTVTGITGTSIVTTHTGLNSYPYPYVSVYKNNILLLESEYSVASSTTITLPVPAVSTDTFRIVKNDKERITTAGNAVITPA